MTFLTVNIKPLGFCVAVVCLFIQVSTTFWAALTAQAQGNNTYRAQGYFLSLKPASTPNVDVISDPSQARWLGRIGALNSPQVCVCNLA